MITAEETRVLTYLRRHVLATVGEIGKKCLPGASPDWAARLLWNLEWLGYVVNYGQDAVQITAKGRATFPRLAGQPARGAQPGRQ